MARPPWLPALPKATPEATSPRVNVPQPPQPVQTSRVADRALPAARVPNKKFQTPTISLDELDAPSLPAVNRTPEGAQRRSPRVQVSKLLNQPVKDDGGEVRGKRPKAVDYRPPVLNLLDIVPPQQAVFDQDELRTMAEALSDALDSFRVEGEITEITVGPVVTIFEFQLARGNKLAGVAKLGDDLAMALRVESVRIAPVPEKGVVGIEIPSSTRLTIYFREVIGSKEFTKAASKMALPCIIGKDVEGAPVIDDLAKMPHVLIGGTTGSGKSVGVNGILLSLLFAKTPDELRLLLIDPKKLEFRLYEDIPHLLHPVVTEPRLASAALAWACREMDERYEVLARWGVRSIVAYNDKVAKKLGNWTSEDTERYCPPDWDGPGAFRPEKMPFIVIVIDELADLMMMAKKEVEESIARLAQKARACGIHLILATQRPSVNVVTGLIKANMPTRMSFKLRTGIDSKTILDSYGAEKLLGKGDLLLLPNNGSVEAVRCHGAFVSDGEVERVTDHLRTQGEPVYIEAVCANPEGAAEVDEKDKDPLYDRAVEFVIRQGAASTSMVQREFRIGYNRAARIIDFMEALGVVGPADGARKREVLMGRATTP